MMISNAEQYLLELINRARLDPLAEAARIGIDLNAGLSAGTLDGAARQVLAHNTLLATAAESHSTWMLDMDVFSHTGDGGSSAGERMQAAGYVFSGSYAWGENLSWRGTTGTPDLEAFIALQHDGLFESEGHRKNLLSGTFREIGIAQVEGAFTDRDGRTYNTSMLTEKFAQSGSQVFVTGVAYTDIDGDGFYSIGEGIAGAHFTTGGITGATAAAGGYQIGIAPASVVNVAISGVATASLILDASDGNAKLDLIGSDWLALSASAQLVSGVANAKLLGVADLNLTGSVDGNKLIGNKGANVLLGDLGKDLLDGGDGDDKLLGGSGDDTLHGGAQEDVLSGEEGDDHLYGGAGFDLLRGGRGADWLDGGAQADNLYGDAGNDTLFGGDGFDRLFGGSEDDLLFGDEGPDALFGQTGHDVLRGGIDSDRLFGGTGNDSLFGDADDDVLYGGAGFDILDGGAGDDELWGNFNADTFVFADGHGADTIRDFEATNPFEKIDLTGVSLAPDISDYTTLLGSGAVTAVAGGVLIDTGNGNSIVLQDVNIADLDNTDFVM
jgi:Ca2+-binding RTX toxin-like protein